MGIRNNNMSVDFNKLEDEFKKRGLKATKVCDEMGRTSSYITCMKPKGYLPKATIIMLDKMWNIKYEDIEPTEDEDVVVTEALADVEDTPNSSVSITKEELRYIITESIKDAFTWYANL